MSRYRYSVEDPSERHTRRLRTALRMHQASPPLDIPPPGFIAEPAPAAVQTTCAECRRPFTTSNAAQHVCDTCAPGSGSARDPRAGDGDSPSRTLEDAA